jgi:uncharacterized protein (DUF1330 family)
MPVYAVAQISIHDRERYERYVARFMAVLTQYGGRLLAADEEADVLEGEWDHDKIIIMRFEDRPAFDKWAGSAEYQEISKDRVAATDGVVLVATGIS